MLNRLKQILKLSKYDDPILERMDSLAAAIEDNQRLSNNGTIFEPEVRGEFLPDMTDEEVLEYERNERLGWKDFKIPK